MLPCQLVLTWKLFQPKSSLKQLSVEQGHSDLISIMQPSARNFHSHVPSLRMGQHTVTGAQVQTGSHSGTFQFSLTHPQLHPQGGYPLTSQEPGRNSFNAFPYNNDPLGRWHMPRVTHPLQCFFCGEKQPDKRVLLKHLEQHNKQVTHKIDLLLEELSCSLGVDQFGQYFMQHGTLSGQQQTLDEDVLDHHSKQGQTGDCLVPSQAVMHRNGLETFVQVPTADVTPESYGDARATPQPSQSTPRIDTNTMDARTADCIPRPSQPDHTESLQYYLQNQATKPANGDSVVDTWKPSTFHGIKGQTLMQATMKLHQPASCVKNSAPDESENQVECTDGSYSSETVASNIQTNTVLPTNRNISCYGQRAASVPCVERNSISQTNEDGSKPGSSSEISALALSLGDRADHTNDLRISYSDDKATALSSPLDKIRAPEVSSMEEPSLPNTSKTSLDNALCITNVWTQREPKEESITCAYEASNGTNHAQLSEGLVESSDKAECSVPSTSKAVPSPDAYRLKDSKHRKDAAWKPSQRESSVNTPTPDPYKNDARSPNTLSDVSASGVPGNENETWRCSLCPKVLSCKSNLERHRLLAHFDDDARQCSLCFEVMPDNTSLDRHRLLVHSEGKTTVGHKTSSWKCSICCAELSAKSSLRRHLYSMHSSASTWKCPACSVLLPSWSSLARHRRTVHGQKWECSLCSKVLSCKASLDRHHLIVHTGRLPLKCPHCEKTFAWRMSLDEHINKHTGERPFECHLCPSKFARRSALWGHLRTHTNERRFACHLCPNAFVTRNHLTRHLGSHRKAKDYKCPVCSARLATNYGLSRHLHKVHNYYRPHECAICGERFCKIKELNVHVRVCRPPADSSADLDLADSS